MGIVAPNSTYRFDGFTLDLARDALFGSQGKQIPLRPKSFALLRLLVENAGTLLSHDAILRTVWPNVVVSDESIVQCVRDVRRALGGTVRSHIRTVPKRGYMLVCPVEIERALPNFAERPLVVVLPFDNLGRDQDQDGFVRGLTEDIITTLSRSPAVTVITTKPGARVHDRRTGYVLHGSVRREVGQVRVWIRLVECFTGACLWAESYNPGLLDRVAGAVSSAIDRAVQAREQQRAMYSQEAQLGPWGYYQRGLWHLRRCSPNDNAQARTLLERAITLDPMLTAAHAALAIIAINEGVIYGRQPIQQCVGLAERWARQGVRLDPDDGDALATLALAEFVSGRIDVSWQQVMLALENSPDLPWARSVSGIIRLYDGDPAGGRERLLQAVQASPVDPRNAIALTQIAISFYFEGDYGSAADAARRAVARYPDHPIAYRWLAIGLGQLGSRAEATKAMGAAMKLLPQTFRRYAMGAPSWMRRSDYHHVLDGHRIAAR